MPETRRQNARASTSGLGRDVLDSTALAKAAPPRRTWALREDEALREAVLMYGSNTGPDSAWPAISQYVGGGRSNKDCRKRWFHTLDPSLKKGRWTAEEDEALRKAFPSTGPQWRKLALLIPGRNDEQVAKRWRDVLAPELRLEAPWTAEEDTLLMKLYEEHGPRWTLMSDSFPTRNGIACRNRFRRYKIPGKDQARPSSSSMSEDNAMETPTFDVSPTDQRLPLPGGSGTLPTDSGSFLDDLLRDDLHRVDDIASEMLVFSAVQSPTRRLDETAHRLDIDPELDPELDHAWADAFWDSHPVHVDDQDQSAPQPDLLAFPIGAQSEQPQNVDPAGIESTLPPNLVATNETVPEWMNLGALPDWFVALTPAASHNPPHMESLAQPFSPVDLSKPIENVWGLLVALENGRDTLTVTASLVRQLLADASRPG